MNLFETTQSTSKYDGVSWKEKRNLWQAEFNINGKVKKFYFDNEVDAAKELNQFCDKMGIPPKIFEICESSNQEVTHIQFFIVFCLSGCTKLHGVFLEDMFSRIELA